MNFNFILKQNLDLMEKLVQNMSLQNYQQKMRENIGKRIVVLFSNRSQPSLLYQVLALEFRKYFTFF